MLRYMPVALLEDGNPKHGFALTTFPAVPARDTKFSDVGHDTQVQVGG